MFKWIKRSQKELCNQQATKTQDDELRLRNVLSKVEEMAQRGDRASQLAILYIIKIYTDRMIANRNTNVLEKQHLDDFKLNHILFATSYEFKTNGSFRIDLGKMPVVTMPRDTDKLTSAIENLATKSNPWKQQGIHDIALFMPLCIAAVLSNGNHSVTAGVVKSVGQVVIKSPKIYDISPFYPNCKFKNGCIIEEYPSRDSIGELCEVDFEIGVLFEIGRILHNYNINFLYLFECIDENKVKSLFP